MAGNTRNGKAFEFACAVAVQEAVADSVMDVSAPFRTAQDCFNELDCDRQDNYMRAAQTGIRMIGGLEPTMAYGVGQLHIAIAADSRGQEGDVRDVLLLRQWDWQIGLSCKHNHDAVKHPRITADRDFGRDWIGVPCSNEFMQAITPVTQSLVDRRNDLWRDEPNKEAYYVPILDAYGAELVRLCAIDGVPAALMQYFFGRQDFFKIIMHEREHSTTVEAFQLNGTLNRPCGRRRPTGRITALRLPTRLIEVARESWTTNILTFDNGWSISMRLHNKDSRMKPTSLAWDVKLQGLPPSVYVNTRTWDE